MVKEVLPSESVQTKKILQVALYHDKLDGIKAGLRMFPASKVIILYQVSESAQSLKRDEQISEYADRLSDVLGVNVELVRVKTALLEDVFDALKQIYEENKDDYDEIILNLTEGDKILTCSALASAFIFGIKAFWTDGNKPYIFPIIKLSYHRTLSDAKLSILNAIYKSGGFVNSLEELVDLTGYDKAQLSYHINGSADSKGLVELGLVDVVRQERGRLGVKLTALGKIFLTGREN